MSMALHSSPEQPCDHCGELHRHGNTFSLTKNGHQQCMCCPACVAVSEMLEQFNGCSAVPDSVQKLPR